MKFKYLLFDLDGTLFDYDAAEAGALKQTFRDFGFDYLDSFLSVYREINRGLWSAFEAGEMTQDLLKVKRFSALAAALDVDFDGKAFSDNYLLNLSKSVTLIDGAERIIKSFYGKAELALITNGLTVVQRPKINNSAIGAYFSHVIISEEIGCAKPDRSIFDYTFELLGNPGKDEVLIIGDSLSSDIKGGTDYGIATCWFNPKKLEHNGHPQPDYEIEHLSELLEIVNA